MTRLAGKRAFITGGAQGQGAAEARAFAREGAQVVIADLNGDLGRRTADELGGQVRFVPLDVTDKDSWASAVAQALGLMGGLDVLVNNAARYWTRPVLEETEDSLDAIFAVNLKGAYFGIQCVAPTMINSGGGSIINVSSVAGMVSHIDHSAYSMTKWGLRGVTRAAAAELATHRIRVNCLVPGAIAGPMLGISVPEDQQHDADMWTSIPMGRVGEPEEVAEAAVFLASNESSFMTATDLVVDGGSVGVR